MFRNLMYMLRRDRFLLLLLIVFIVEGPLMRLMSGGISGLISWVVDTLLIVPAIMIGLSFHEFGHAKVAQLSGDNTPVYQGRVTLDPRAHIDPMGLISLIFLGFGWGRPVQINPLNFRDRRLDSILVGVAGISMNLLVAVVTSFLLRLVYHSGSFFDSGIGSALTSVLLNIVYINIYLMMFNLLPVPPLDGYGLVGDIFNIRNNRTYQILYLNSRYILLMVLILRLPSTLLSPVCGRIINFLIRTIVY